MSVNKYFFSSPFVEMSVNKYFFRPIAKMSVNKYFFPGRLPKCLLINIFSRPVAEMSGSQPSFAVPGTSFSPLASWVLHHHPNLFGRTQEIVRICIRFPSLAIFFLHDHPNLFGGTQEICIRFPSANSVIGEAS